MGMSASVSTGGSIWVPGMMVGTWGVRAGRRYAAHSTCALHVEKEIKRMRKAQN